MTTRLLILLASLVIAAPAWAVTAVVTWNPAPESDVVKYRLYRATGSPCTTNSPLLAEVVAPNTQYVDQGIDGTKYYCVTAVDGVGQESTVSATATATYPTTVQIQCSP